MKLFISYAHTDKWQVQQIADLLKQGGHDPWFDTQLMPGEDWQKEIEANISACEVFLYALSPESVASEWCRWEFAKAVALDKPIIPILIQSNTTIPESITKHQYIDFSQGMTPETSAKLMGGLMQFAISVTKDDVPDIETPKESKPARAEPPQKHVFVSYSRYDSSMMFQIRDRLKNANIPVWTDESIKTGAAHWQTVIERAIENAGCVLVLLSPEAKDSEWVRRELAYAKTHAIQIIPVLLRGDDRNAIPFDVMGVQHVDLQRDYETGIQEVVRSVREYTLQGASSDATPVATTQTPQQQFDKGLWEKLMRVISRGRCTPFIGSGLDRGLVSSREEIARVWANKHNYPFAPGYDRDLARVAHFVTIDMGGDPFWAKDDIVQTWLSDVNLTTLEDKKDQNQAYEILASFDFPVYITTNYHDLLYLTLEKKGKKPQRVFWFENKWHSSTGDKVNNEVSSEEPMVFHLYGHQSEPESMVLTEDDYLNFLVRMATVNEEKNKDRQFPTAVTQVIGTSSYLFVGFTVTDWNLRILFHLLATHGRTGRGPHIAVQIEPTRDLPSVQQKDRIKNYLEGYFRDHIGTFADVYIGDTLAFVQELKQQWDKGQTNG